MQILPSSSRLKAPQENQNGKPENLFLLVIAFSLPYLSPSTLKNELKSCQSSQQRHSPLIKGGILELSEQLGDPLGAQGLLSWLVQVGQ